MATQLQILAGTIANDTSVGTAAWVNPTNAGVSDNIYATVTGGGNQISNYIKATNFGFSIPTGATINGILVEIEAKYQTGSSRSSYQSSVKIVKADGTIGTTNKSTGSVLPATESYISFGSSSDLWGETWDNTKINDIDFGVVFSVGLSEGIAANVTASVDHIRITVYYTPPATITGVGSIQGLSTITL